MELFLFDSEIGVTFHPRTASKMAKAVPAITGDIVYQSPVFELPTSLAPWKIPMLSYTASMVSTTMGYPLDSIKTRMQAHRYANSWVCFRTTVANEGFRGLYRGILVPLVTSSISKSIGVSIYSYFKTPVAQHVDVSSNVWVNNFPSSFVAGCISGACVSAFACPFELTKIFQQIVLVVNKEANMGINTRLLPKTVNEVFMNIVRYQGVFGLYSGFSYHLLRDSLSTGLFFAVYESTKMILNEVVPEGFQMMSVPLAGCIAGITSWILVFPIDTIKSQYQRDIVRNIIREKSGLEKMPVIARRWSLPKRDLYRGLGPSITKAVCTTTIFFSGFEYLMRHVK